MRIIPFKNEHHREHFAFFRNMGQPHFNIVANVDFGRAFEVIKGQRLHFTSVVVYLICKTANEIPQLRRRVRDDHIIEHDTVHPSFTIPARKSGVFSFCYVEYTPDFAQFSSQVQAAISANTELPSFEDEEGRDDYLFLSAVPWVHFTSVSHAMHTSNVDSVPRICWGKMAGASGMEMPVSLQAHHSVADGEHAGLFYQHLQENIQKFA